MHTQKPNGAEKEPASAPPLISAPTETVRRTRGSASSPRSQAASKASSHVNGSANHAAAADGAASLSSGFVSTDPETRAGFRANGHGHAFSSDSAEANASPLSLEAGADDASGASVAMASASAGPGADRDACAALAERSDRKKRHSSSTLLSGEEQPRVPSEVTLAAANDAATGKVAGESRKHSPGEEPLPADPADFVEEIHSRIDLFQIWGELLKSDDEKIKQRAVEKLTEMRYKGAQSLAEEPQQVVFELTRTKRDE